MTTLSFLDQVNNIITIDFPPKRIVSLVPSQTELLADLGLDSEVVGITKFCVHPRAWTDPKTIVGGTKNFDFAIIDELQPDLIIGNKEENYKDGITTLQQRYPVWISDITTYTDAVSMISSIGALTDHKTEAERILLDMEDAFKTLRTFQGQSVLYLIWRKPWMAAGTGTFIHEMLTKLNLTNIIPAERYPELTSADIESLRPDYILLSSEPFPFSDKHINELQQICPSANILLVDGEMFSWYGSRLIQAPAYFNSLNLR